jgi:hypothetical protein
MVRDMLFFTAGALSMMVMIGITIVQLVKYMEEQRKS